MNTASSLKSYGTYADFEREELRPMNKIGFSIDDLEVEAGLKHFDEHPADTNLAELDFG